MDLRRIFHDTTSSTSDEAFRTIESGTAQHGDVHQAREQSLGRGRLGRRWHSPRGEGLYASLIWMPPPPAPPAPAITMASALGVRDGLGRLGLAGVTVRWPNDLEVEGAKLAGILVETRGLVPERPQYVIGIGVDVAQRSFPDDLTAERPVTSLALLGVAVAIETVADAVLGDLAERLEAASMDPGRLEEDFLAATGLVGAAVTLECGSDSLEGTVLGLTLAEGLALRTPGGVRTVPLEVVRAVRVAHPGP